MGIALAIAYLLRLNLTISALCTLLPDIIDKTISAVGGPGGGRYIGHTLLFVFAVSLVFFCWKIRYGAAALVGGISHLLLDIGSLVPWFYPFKNYEFYDDEFSFVEYLKDYLSWDDMRFELLIVAAVSLTALIGLRICRHYRRLR